MNFEIPKRQPPLRSHRKKDLYKLLVARSDIDAARSVSELFLKTVTSISDELYYPLFSAIIVCYARPFTNNEPYGALSQKWTKFDDATLQDLHDAIVRARHELVAHSDMAVRKAQIVPPNVVTGRLPNGRELKSAQIGTQTNYYLFKIPMMRDIPRLTLDLGRRITAEIESLLAELYEGMDLPNTSFTLRIDEGL